MKKIPFEATFTGAYKFLFTRIFSIIGTVWLPMLVFGAIGAGILYLAIPHGWWQGQFPVLDEKHPDPEAVMSLVLPFFMAFFPVMIVMLLMGAMTTVGLMQLALGQKKRCFIYFSMGADFWRLIGNWLLSFLVLMLMYVLMVGAFILGIIFLAPLMSNGWGALLAVVAGIGALVFWIYVPIRLTYFLPAVAVAEHEVNLGRSWELAAGNFWRIVGISLLVAIPPSIVAQVLLEIVVVSPLFSNLVPLIEKTHDIATIFHAALPLAGVYLGVLFLQSIAIVALKAGAIAKAYLALTTDNEVTP